MRDKQRYTAAVMNTGAMVSMMRYLLPNGQPNVEVASFETCLHEEKVGGEWIDVKTDSCAIADRFEYQSYDHACHKAPGPVLDP